MDLNLYDDKKNTTKVIVCDHCKKEWLSSETVFNKQTIKAPDETIEVTFFVCSNCGEPYIVSIDNNNTKAVKLRLELEMKRLKKAESKGHSTEKYSKKVTRLYNELKKLHESLNTIYKGAFTKHHP